MIVSRMILATILCVSLSLGSAYGMSWDEQILHNYESGFWDLGSTINDDDTFHYRICDDKIPDDYMEISCYDIVLSFVSLMESPSGPIWIVQGELLKEDYSDFLILEVNPETFQVKTDKANIPLADSLERTIFNLAKYPPTPITIGVQWDDVQSYFTNNVPLEITRQEILTDSFGDYQTSVLNYQVIENSDIWISQEFAFPIKAVVYSPQIIFPEPQQDYYYELINYYGSEDYQTVQPNYTNDENLLMCPELLEGQSFQVIDEFGNVIDVTDDLVSDVHGHEHFEESFEESFEEDYTEDFTEYFEDEFIPINPEVRP